MGFSIKTVRAYLDGVSQEAAQEGRQRGDVSLQVALQPILSQFHIIEGAKTLDDQKAGCQQLSHTIMVLQVMQADPIIADRLNDVRVHIGQFGFMGTE